MNTTYFGDDNFAQYQLPPIGPSPIVTPLPLYTNAQAPDYAYEPPVVSIPFISPLPENEKTDEWKWHVKSNNKLKNGTTARYYVCASRTCPARKNVKYSNDGIVIEVKYKGEHNHPLMPLTRPTYNPSAMFTSYPAPVAPDAIIEENELETDLPVWFPKNDFFSEFDSFKNFIKHFSIYPSLQVIIASDFGLSLLGTSGVEIALVPYEHPESLEITAVICTVPNSEGKYILTSLLITSTTTEIDHNIKSKLNVLRMLSDMTASRWSPKVIVTNLTSSWLHAARLCFGIIYPETVGGLKSSLIVNTLRHETEVTTCWCLLSSCLRINSSLIEQLHGIYLNTNQNEAVSKLDEFSGNLEPMTRALMRSFLSSYIHSPKDWLMCFRVNVVGVGRLNLSVKSFMHEIGCVLENMTRMNDKSLLVKIVKNCIDIIDKADQSSSIVLTRLRRGDNVGGNGMMNINMN